MNKRTVGMIGFFGFVAAGVFAMVSVLSPVAIPETAQGGLSKAVHTAAHVEQVPTVLETMTIVGDRPVAKKAATRSTCKTPIRIGDGARDLEQGRGTVTAWETVCLRTNG